MTFSPKITAFITSLLLVSLAACASFADTLGRVSGASGAPPKTLLVEQPQDALTHWRLQGRRGGTLLLISDDIPLARLDDPACGLVLKDIAEGRFESVLSKGYRTPDYYPVDRANYVYVANRAGMISRVFWVPPTKDPMDGAALARTRAKFASIGATDAELEGLVLTGGAISGSVNGVPVTVVNLRDVQPFDEEAVLAVDLTFFNAVYKNEVNTPMLGLFTGFANTLSKSGVKVSEAVVSYSTSGGDVPLEWRFLGGYLERFLSDPGSLEDGPPASWLLRAAAMHHETFFQPEEELAAYREAVDSAPNDASLRFGLALAYLAMRNVDRMKEELDRAVSLDRGYYRAYISYGKYLAGKDVAEAGEDFLAEAASINPDDPDVWEAMGEIMRAAGKYREAAEAQKKLIALGYDGPLPYWGLAENYLSLKEYRQAVECYIKALGMLPVLDTELRPKACLGLADAYEGLGEIDKALGACREAMDSTVDEHSKAKINEKCESLKTRWKPFMGGG